ncbi:MAG: hypothetical protein KDD00_10325 [Ignavibacteriae bacterium]|nr:hypothetical protein [Ignavibacteriota bacterium]
MKNIKLSIIRQIYFPLTNPDSKINDKWFTFNFNQFELFSYKYLNT